MAQHTKESNLYTMPKLILRYELVPRLQTAFPWYSELINF